MSEAMAAAPAQSAAAEQAGPVGPLAEMTLTAYSRLALSASAEQLRARTVLLTGFVLPGDSSTSWYLTRLVATAGAADARPVRVEVRSAVPAATGTWVGVLGTWPGAPGGTVDAPLAVIEAVAELFMAGMLTPDGRFAPEIESPRLSWQGAKAEYVLAWPHETSTGRPVVITSEDVRNIQLGKAALYSGARLLMDRMGVDRVDRVMLAGAFGSYIDSKHAMVLGMIPDCDLARVTTVGNSAGDGARIALLNKNEREDARRLARWTSYIGIALEPRFQDAFVEAMPLPHSVDSFPHLAETLEAATARRRARGVSDIVKARSRRRQVVSTEGGQ